MKVDKVVISYGEKRSANFQTVDHALSIEVLLEEGESPIEAIKKYKGVLRDLVTGFTAEQANRLMDESKGVR